MIEKSQWIHETGLPVPLEKWQQLANLLADICHAPAGFIVQHTDKGYHVTISSEHDANPYDAGAVIEPDVNLFCRKIVETNQELYVRHATCMDEWQSNPEVSEDGFNSYLGVPIHWPNENVFGTLCVMDFAKTDYAKTYKELIRHLRDLIEADLLMLENLEQMKQLAMTDELTRLYNRRGFVQVAHQRMQLSRRNDKKLMLAYLDQNNLKLINDRHNHQVGDSVLVHLASLLIQEFRQSDICARIGGDEFLVLTDADNEDAIQERCETINLKMQRYTAELTGTAFGVSYGMVENQQQLTIEEWIDAADQAMYQDKSIKRKSMH